MVDQLEVAGVTEPVLQMGTVVRTLPMNAVTLVSNCTIEFYLPVIIVIIPDMLVTNLITKLSKPCLVVMICQTMLA